MKTLLRMLVFSIIGAVVASAVSGAVVIAVLEPLPEAVQMLADQGDRGAMLRSALRSETFNYAINAVLWAVLVGMVFVQEIGWRAWRRPQPMKPWPGLLRWLGAATASFIIVLWGNAIYKLILIWTLPEYYLAQPARYSREIAEFGRRFEVDGWVLLIGWLVITAIVGSHASRSANSHFEHRLGQQSV